MTRAVRPSIHDTHCSCAIILNNPEAVSLVALACSFHVVHVGLGIEGFDDVVVAALAFARTVHVCGLATRIVFVGASDNADICTALERVDFVVPAVIVTLVVPVRKISVPSVVAEVVVAALELCLFVDAAAGSRGALIVNDIEDAGDSTNGSCLFI